MSRIAPIKNYEAGEIVFREGDRADRGYIIEKGRVEISVQSPEGKKVIAVLNKDEVFGEMGIIDDTVRSASATCIMPTTLVTVSREQIRDRVQKSDPVVRMLLKVFMERLRDGIRHTEEAIQDISIKIKNYDAQNFPDAAEEDHSDATRKIKKESQLAHAVTNQEFELYYQPIVELTTARIIGYEALLRWNHPETSVISPVHFIELAEETDLIIPIGRWVLEQALHDYEILRSTMSQTPIDGKSPFVSVNISGRQLSYPDFFGELERMMEKFKILPENLNLEVTETSLVQSDHAVEWTKKCTDLGINVSLDDFGTGYSSLSYLSQLQISGLKVDREFVKEVTTHPKDAAIVKSIIMLANDLGLGIVAEGIETIDQAEQLTGLNCIFGQGYYYGRPQPLAKALKMFKKRKAAA